MGRQWYQLDSFDESTIRRFDVAHEPPAKVDQCSKTNKFICNEFGLQRLSSLNPRDLLFRPEQKAMKGIITVLLQEVNKRPLFSSRDNAVFIVFTDVRDVREFHLPTTTSDPK